ncbi:MAG: SpoIIE family protein phosphatase [Smithella sp.]
MGNFVKNALHKYEVEIVLAETAFEGLIKFGQYAPCLVIAAANLPTLNGYSLSAIIKGAPKGDACSIYMVINNNELTIPNAAGIDYLVMQPIQWELLAMQLQCFFEKRAMAEYHLSEIIRAKNRQNELLPHKLQTESFTVDYIYSPYNELSGDCLDYWYGRNENGLFGFIFDCTGHDLCSFLQVSEIRTIIRWGFRCYQQQSLYDDLGDIMKNVNTELFYSHGDNVSCVAAIIFFLDFKTNQLHYCSAGIPSFYIKKASSDQYTEVEMENYLIGYDPKADFIEKSLSTEKVDEVIFSSDGFSELLFKKDIKNPKHDDVSAIFIQLKKQKMCS